MQLRDEGDLLTTRVASALECWRSHSSVAASFTLELPGSYCLTLVLHLFLHMPLASSDPGNLEGKNIQISIPRYTLTR